MTEEGVTAIEEMWDRQAAAEERYSTPYLDLTREDVVAFAHGAPGPVVPGTFRVLRRGGRYKVAHCNPATYAVSFTGGDSGWDGKGYRIAEPY
ncbi:MAG TPA: hypothetical protein VGO00_24065, partial [Kofleriaceae bacterium]|nr:hypothetical protein [Kofleriaceae bacterium]